MTVLDIVLQTPGAADRERVRAMVEGAGVFRSDEVAVALEVFDDAVAAPGQDYWPLGAYEGDRLVGFALFGPVPCTLGTWDLYWIVVDPTTRRGGIGRLLMRQCEAVVRREGGRLIVVETSSRTDYAPTRAFYDHLGYRAQAVLPAYYARGDDLVVYTKYLHSSHSSDHGTAHG